jgi:hypothetical protein
MRDDKTLYLGSEGLTATSGNTARRPVTVTSPMRTKARRRNIRTPERSLCALPCLRQRARITTDI